MLWYNQKIALILYLYMKVNHLIKKVTIKK